MRRPSIESVVVGALFSASLTFVAICLEAVLGFGSRLAPRVAVAGGLITVAAVVGAHRKLEDLPFRLGAAAGLVLVLGWEFWSGSSGLGRIQITALVVTALVVVLGVRAAAPFTRPIPRIVIGLGLFLLGVALVRIVVGSGQLGHDEAAYALKARAWLYDTPHTGWSLHRGIGQSVLAAAVLPFSQSPLALRAVAVVFTLGTVVVLWLLGRDLRSSRVGLLAAAVFAVAPSFLRRGTEFLTDLPAAGLLFVVTWLLWRWLQDPKARNGHLYWAVGVGAVAYYIRYQSILALGLIAIASVIVGWKRLKGRWGVVGSAALLGVALLIPHVVHSVLHTGTPWGILLATSGAGGREFLGEGLVDYLMHLPDLLAGQLGGALIVLALVWALWRLVRGGDRKVVGFLLVPALGQIVALGLVSHGEPRFVFYPVGLLVVAGSLALDDLRRFFPRVAYRVGAWTAVALVLGSLAIHGPRVDGNAEARAANFEVLVQAAEHVVSSSDGPCGIVTGLLPQMTWLSGCATEGFHRDPEVFLPESYDRFLLLVEEGPRQPAGLSDYLELTEGEPTPIPGQGNLGSAEVYRVK